MTFRILVANFIEYFVFFIPILEILLNVFSQVDSEGEPYAIAHSSTYVLVPSM